MLGFLFVSALVLCIGLMGYVVGKAVEEMTEEEKDAKD